MNLFTITFDDDSDEKSSNYYSNSDQITKSTSENAPPAKTISPPHIPIPPRVRRPIPKQANNRNPGQNLSINESKQRRTRETRSIPQPTNVYKYTPTVDQSISLQKDSNNHQLKKTVISTSESDESTSYFEEEEESESTEQNSPQIESTGQNPPQIKSSETNRHTHSINSESHQIQNEISQNSNQSIQPVFNSLPQTFTSYRVNRVKTVSLRGKTTHFQLYLLGRPLLHSKIKSKKKKGTLYISEGTSLHFKSDDYLAALLYGNNCCSFSLRKKNEYGEEIMSIKYQSGINGAPRSVFVEFPKPDENIPQYLSSRSSHLNESNEWVLDMHGKFNMNSIKNCVIVDENDHEYAFIMKVEKSILGVEVIEQFTDLMAFALALSAFICKI